MSGNKFKIRENMSPMRKEDCVRLSITKESFDDGYEQMFITVDETVSKGQILMYCLVDYSQQAIKAVFFSKKLQELNPDEDRICKIENFLAVKRKRRKKQLFVVWLALEV